MPDPTHQPLPHITVIELAQKLAESAASLQLVDVREPWEVETAHLDGFVNLPLSNYADWSSDIQTRLNAETETLVLCHHGIRSAQMCQWLIMQGFSNVKNISGGIAEYSRQVDSSVPQY
ncbi:rhodanese-like domain-containing protein [Myxacorys almedinensis]|uniref:Rhodanese-related sulfurtransferase n=1 Tax=Myxacorys almedinensis A TaxID=2690445 RepID=A0A8J7Z057_9CYAN|nr:rhodanese-like domain-containing protein [Myxacorys almedinensis]NDJ16615.1 rhodanese-related sulfurtransferase [Myxacorys almedinensis A]